MTSTRKILPLHEKKNNTKLPGEATLNI